MLVCLLVTTESPAKMTELIEMLILGVDFGGFKESRIRWRSRSPTGMEIFGGGSFGPLKNRKAVAIIGKCRDFVINSPTCQLADE